MFPWLTSFQDITVQDSDESSSGQRCPGQVKLRTALIWTAMSLARDSAVLDKSNLMQR